MRSKVLHPLKSEGADNTMARPSSQHDARLLVNPRANGSVFILTLAILLVLTSMALVLSRTMRVEAASTANHVSQLQAESIAQGAIAYLKITLADHDGSVPDEDTILSQAVPVGDGYYWLLKPNYEDATSHNFGLIDEQGKLNINTAELEDIAGLPNMTQELAAGIVDWRDDNEEAESGGAETAYYASLVPAYRAKNDLFESVEELQLVKDMTPAVLYGEDVNRNGKLDENENDADESLPQDNRDSLLDYGLAAFVTVYSSQQVLDADGQTRVNVNAGNQFIAVLQEAVASSRIEQVIIDTRRNRPFENLIDYYYRVGLQESEFEKIVDKLTVGTDRAKGQVNLNTAPKQVLAALPGLTDSDVQNIVERQKSDEPFETILDVIKLLSRDKAIAIGGSVSTKSYRYSADIVATDAKGRGFKRLLVVFDTQTSPVRVLYIRDLTSLGWPLDPVILSDLRAGQPPAEPGSNVTGSLAFSTKILGVQ